MASTGFTFPGAGVSSGGIGWSNPGNITANDNNLASSAPVLENEFTGLLRARTFGFAIPANAQIDGIQARYERRGAAIRTVVETLIGAAGSAVGENKSDGAVWPGTLTVKSLGSTTDLWGTSWTPADINDSDFGFGVNARLEGGGPALAEVDYIQVNVHYSTPPAAPTDCVAQQAVDAVVVTWTDNATDEDNYEIQRRVDGGSYTTLSAVLAAGTTTYKDTSPPFGSVQYRVRALKTSGPDSNWAESAAINFIPYAGRAGAVFYS